MYMYVCVSTRVDIAFLFLAQRNENDGEMREFDGYPDPEGKRTRFAKSPGFVKRTRLTSITGVNTG
jgi:hypothetical protein